MSKSFSSCFTMKNAPLPIYTQIDIPICIYVLLLISCFLYYVFVVVIAVSNVCGTLERNL